MKANKKIIKAKLKILLTDREVEVFFQVSDGVSNLEAAKKLKITEGTVKFHLTNIFHKLDIQRRSQITLLAHGLEPL